MTWHPSSPAVSLKEIECAECLVLHCWAEWNEYDRVLDSRLSAASTEFRACAAFRAADVDEPSLAATLHAWNIVNVPALLLLRQGRKIAVHCGLLSEEDLASLLHRWLR
ncbi:MAG TPA: thioredoxin family protein [Polyangiaceae bacterium]|nr:thioredoxin family protein [Polyangiaceae bacterium]